MKPRSGLLAAALLAASLLPLAPRASAQCSMCRATVENSEEGRRTASDLNRAIMLMFLAPYAVFGTCASVLFRRRILGFARQHAHGALALGGRLTAVPDARRGSGREAGPAEESSLP